MKCKKGYEVGIFQSNAGYYKGTLDEFGMPNCRLSTRYAKTKDEAKNLPLDRMCAMENEYCSGNGNCFN